jgi:hypoxanthine phosphoribosyltransferase
VDQSIEYEAPTWNQIYTMLLDVADKIRNNSFRPDTIIGVSRGGWLPARILSDLLNNPNLASVRAELYVGVAETKGEATITQPVSTCVTGKNVLIVDEVADTGKSLKLIKDHMIEERAATVKIATVYYKPWSTVRPDYFEKETSRWIVFPWEIKETVAKIRNKYRKDETAFEKEKTKLIETGIPEALFTRFLKEITEEDKC